MIHILSNPKKLEQIERAIDSRLERLFAHPTFLSSVSTVLNLNSYRKLLINYALTQAWRGLQLPNKRDQERTLHLIHELTHRVETLKEELDRLARQNGHAATEDRIASEKEEIAVLKKPLRKVKSEQTTETREPAVAFQ